MAERIYLQDIQGEVLTTARTHLETPEDQGRIYRLRQEEALEEMAKDGLILGFDVAVDKDINNKKGEIFNITTLNNEVVPLAVVSTKHSKHRRNNQAKKNGQEIIPVIYLRKLKSKTGELKSAEEIKKETMDLIGKYLQQNTI